MITKERLDELETRNEDATGGLPHGAVVQLIAAAREAHRLFAAMAALVRELRSDADDFLSQGDRHHASDMRDMAEHLEAVILQVSAAENLNKEEATRGTSAATPPPDVCPECAANHEASERILALARETLARRDIHGAVEGTEAMAKAIEVLRREITITDASFHRACDQRDAERANVEIGKQVARDVLSEKYALADQLRTLAADLATAERTRNAAQAEANRLLEENRELREQNQHLQGAVLASTRRDIDAMMDYHCGWADATFGPDYPIGATLAHVEKEIKEIKADIRNPEEWIDLIRLGMDGFRRAGGSSLSAGWWEKQRICEGRKWAIGADGQPAEHVRE